MSALLVAFVVLIVEIKKLGFAFHQICRRRRMAQPAGGAVLAE